MGVGGADVRCINLGNKFKQEIDSITARGAD